MKGKNSARPQSKVSFAVNRDEIDISSEWVNAVLRTPEPEPRIRPAGVLIVPKSMAAGSPTVVPLVATVSNVATVANEGTARNEETVVNISAVEQRATVAVSREYHLKPIRKLTDGLTPGQYTLYSLMYGAGSESAGETDRAKLYRGGYKDLCDLSGLSKRGVQNVIRELLDKRVVEIHQAPGYHRSQTSVYRVLSEAQVMESWMKAGWRHAVGKGKDLRA